MSRALTAPSTAIGERQRPLIVDVAAPLYVVLYLLVAFLPFEGLVNMPGSVPSFVVPGIGLCVLALTPTTRLSRLPINLSLVAFVVWSALSVLWSRDPGSTIFAIRSELFPLIVVALVAGTVPPRVLARAVLQGSLVLCAWSLLSSIALSSSRSTILSDTLETQFGFRGTFGHKNDLGVFAVLTLAAALPMLRMRGRRVILALLVLTAMATRSATAGSGLLALAFLYAWMLAIGRGRSQRDRRLLLTISVTSAIVALLSALRLMPIVLALYDKDVTFSGRTIIWAASFDVFAQRPLTGWGLGGVFTEVPTSLTMELWQHIGFEAAHTHNGAMEVLIELGIIGLVMLTAVIVSIYRVANRVGRYDDARPEARWAVLFMTSLVVMAIAEPLLTGPYLGYMAIVWAVVANLENEHRHPDRRARLSTW
jgi:O-antigen ligase